jgi:hypothetical protein
MRGRLALFVGQLELPDRLGGDEEHPILIGGGDRDDVIL